MPATSEIELIPGNAPDASRYSALMKALQIAALAALLASFDASRARADGPPIALDVEDPAQRLDEAALREGLARDLGVAVDPGVTIDADAASAPATIRVRVTAEGAVEIAFLHADGERRRSVEIPADASEAARVVVLIAANLAREEASGLLTALTPSPVEIVEERIEADPGALADPTVAPPRRRARRPPATRGMHFGIVHRAGAAVARLADIGGPSPLLATGAGGFFQLGLEFQLAITPLISIGITDFTGSIALSGGTGRGEQWLFSLGMTPYAELGGFVDERVQLYGRAGIAGQAWSYTSDPLQAALYAAAGIRFFVADNFSIGLELAVNVVLSDSYLIGNLPGIRIPQWSTPGSGAVTTSWHF
jgi:hypothetical protein